MSPLPIAERARAAPTPGWSRARAAVWLVLMLAMGAWMVMILRA